MKFLFAFALLLYSVSGFSQNNPNVSEKEWMDSFAVNLRRVIGKELNHFEVKANSGTVYTNDSLKDKITLVNFWFEACAPCIAEFDELNKLYEKFKINKNFRILAFTYETPEEVKRIKEKYQLKYELLPVSMEMCFELNFKYGFPLNIITNRDAKVSYIQPGGKTDKVKVAVDFSGIYIPEISKLLEE